MSTPAYAAMALIDRQTEGVRRWPLYPVIVPVAFVLDIWLKTSLDPSQLVRPIVITLLAALALTAIAVAIARDRDKGGALAGIVAVGLVGGDDLRIAALAFGAVCLVSILVRHEASLAGSLPWRHLTRLIDLVAMCWSGSSPRPPRVH